VSVWNKALAELANWMVATKIHPQLQQEILAGLQWWHDSQLTLSLISDGLPASILQEKIGWGVVLVQTVASSGKHSKPRNLANNGQCH